MGLLSINSSIKIKNEHFYKSEGICLQTILYEFASASPRPNLEKQIKHFRKSIIFAKNIRYNIDDQIISRFIPQCLCPNNKT